MFVRIIQGGELFSPRGCADISWESVIAGPLDSRYRSARRVHRGVQAPGDPASRMSENCEASSQFMHSLIPIPQVGSTFIGSLHVQSHHDDVQIKIVCIHRPSGVRSTCECFRRYRREGTLGCSTARREPSDGSQRAAANLAAPILPSFLFSFVFCGHTLFILLLASICFFSQAAAVHSSSRAASWMHG